MSPDEPPLPTDRFDGKGRSVIPVLDDWYPVCLTAELGRRPRREALFSMPLVVFRDENGRARALLDRCPHRNAPLSAGTVADGRLRCGYHGWEFDGHGRCVHVPGFPGGLAASDRERRAPPFACHERDGLVWVYATADTMPVREPPRFPLASDKHYTTVTLRRRMLGSLHATAENALDVPHTAFLHAGLFRRAAAARRPIEVLVRRFHDRAEAIFLGEQRPAGLLGALLAPQGGEVRHVDRFRMPCVVEVEYGLGEHHLMAAAALGPVSDHVTDLFAVASVRAPIPAVVLRALVVPVASKVLAQDGAMLAAQSETIRRFRGERFESTALDVLGAHIARLLHDAQGGRRSLPSDAPAAEKRVTMLV